MIKKIKLVVLFVFAMFLMTSTTYAASASWYNGMTCGSDVTLSSGIVSRTCQMSFEVSGGTLDKNIAVLNLVPKNFYVHTITAKENWKLTNSVKDTSYTFEYNKSELSTGTYEIAEIVFYKVDPKLIDPENCYILYNYTFDYINRSCYFDPATNTYYGKTGNKLEGLLQYQKECQRNVCKILSDGTIYGKDGTTVEKDQYERECLKLSCAMQVATCTSDSDCTDNKYEPYGYTLKEKEKITKYYNKKGEETTEDYFDYECGAHYCKKLNVPTRTCDSSTRYCYDGGKTVYFNKAGEETSLENYYKECFTYKCEIVYGSFFGKNGIEISKLDYQKECDENACKVLEDGTKYGKNGYIVDDLTYRKECEKIVCEKLSDGTFYGKDGTVVSEDEYNAYCGALQNAPQTGMSIPVILLSGFAVIGLICYVAIKRQDKIVNKL